MCMNEVHGRLTRHLPLYYKDLPEEYQKLYTKIRWNKTKLTYDIPLPCGYCLECRLNKAKDFSIKCMAEAKMHSKNCFLTLTYNDKHLPQTKNGLNTVKLDDIQKFFKRLLKDNPDCQIRRFYSCEYGYTGTRRYNGGNPHYHAIVFGWKPNDLIYYKTNKKTGDIWYKSKYLYKLWGKGFVVIGDVTIESAGYTCRYTMKKAGVKPLKKWKIAPNPRYNPNYPKDSKVNRGINKWIYEKEVQIWTDGRIDDREPERLNTSKRPGIGHPFWEAYMDKIKAQEGFYVHTKKGVKLMGLAKIWREKWKNSEDWENFYRYSYRQQKRYEEFKNNEMQLHPGFTWEEIKEMRYNALKERVKSLKRMEDFYTQEF